MLKGLRGHSSLYLTNRQAGHKSLGQRYNVCAQQYWGLPGTTHWCLGVSDIESARGPVVPRSSSGPSAWQHTHFTRIITLPWRYSTSHTTSHTVTMWLLVFAHTGKLRPSLPATKILIRLFYSSHLSLTNFPDEIVSTLSSLFKPDPVYHSTHLLVPASTNDYFCIVISSF